jgi:hypothetical protein
MNDEGRQTATRQIPEAGSIGLQFARPHQNPETSGSVLRPNAATYLIDVKSGHRVWAGSHTFVVPFVKEVAVRHWQLAQERLNELAQVPLHISFLHSAEQSYSVGYFQRSIVELALACETYLRYSVTEHFPDDLSEVLTTYIQEANISQYINQFFRNLVSEQDKPAYRKLKDEIVSLMSKRNTFVHMGVMKGANETNCRRYAEMAKQLFGIGLVKKDESQASDLP